MKPGWSTARLGDLVSFHSGGTPSKAQQRFWEGDVPWFSAKDLKHDRLSDSIDHVSESVFRETSLRRFPAETIVLVVRGMILAHTIPISILGIPAAINQDLKALLPRRPGEFDTVYLASALRAQHRDLLAEVGTAAHGTTKLDSHVLENLEIPLPPLDEQRRIAAVLDHVENLRASRRNALALWRSLPASRFAAIVRSGFPEVVLGDVTHAVVSGRNIVASDGEPEHALFRVLPVGAVTFGRFRSTGLKPIPADYAPPANHLVHKGDLLFGRANTEELVGAVAIVDSVPEGTLLPDKIWRIEELVDQVDRVFLRHAMASTPFRQQVRRRASGTSSSMKNISKRKLIEIPLPLPPMTVQREFAAEVARFDTLGAAAERHLADLDALYASLQSRAFAGELDVSKVPLPS